MPALSKHLRDRQTHARLAFHPDCPICRDERLLGSIPSPAVVSQRAGAAMAAAVLAVTTVGPAAAFAGEPDQRSEGTTEPSQEASDDGTRPAAGDHAHDAGFDPGDGAASRPPDAQQDDDNAPPDGAAADADPPPASAQDAQDGRDQPSAPEEPTAQPPAQPPPAEAPAADQAPPAPPSQGQPSPAARDSATPRAPRARATRRPRSQTRTAQVPRGASAQPATAAQAPRSAAAQAHTAAQMPLSASAQPDGAAEAVAPAPAPTTPSPAENASPDDRTHTVQAGESLWSIASDILDPRASPLQIAREVHRLWELNKDRIATGDPDLLMTGTRLRLR